MGPALPDGLALSPRPWTHAAEDYTAAPRRGDETILAVYADDALLPGTGNTQEDDAETARTRRGDDASSVSRQL